MKKLIPVITAVLVLSLMLSSSLMADDSQMVTITMTGASEIAISLTITHWPLGDVAPNTEYYTNPEKQWCTLEVTGNSAVDTFIEARDATWADDHDAYKWTLSDDGSNGPDVFGLWFRIAGDTTRGPNDDGYVPITKTQSEFWPYDDGDSLEPEDTKQFGLRLLTPSEFTGGRTMETQITISAVAP